MSAVGDRLTGWSYLLAWRAVRLLPEPAAYGLSRLLARVLLRRGGRPVRRLRDNLARAVPDVGPEQLRALTGLALESYLRYWVDAFRLPDWDERRIVGTIRTEGEAAVREALDGGRGVVGALAHLGNWDHAGAWSHLRLSTVTTVAERLRPESVFLRFLRFRTDLGIEILAHPHRGRPGGGDASAPTGAPGPPPPSVTEVLEQRLRDGRFVPLLADRDLSGRGVEVDLLGEPARVASGPAVLAGRTGALLLPVGIAYERSAASPSGWGTVVRFLEPFEVPDDSPEQVATAMQRVTDALGEQIRRDPADWHMLQAVFVRDVGRDPSPW